MTKDMPQPLAGKVLLFLMLATVFIVAGCGGSTAPTPDAMDNLGGLAYKAGDRDAARVWYEKAAKFGHPGAMFSLGMLAYEEGDKATARDWWGQAINRWEQAAKLGDTDAMNRLGGLARLGGDVHAARAWYRKAAKLGNEDAARSLAKLEASLNCVNLMTASITGACFP